MGSGAVSTLFLSWWHGDQRPAKALLDRLVPNLQILSDVDVRLWDDAKILLGHDWHTAIQAASGDCDYGLLLLSPGFFASRYVVEHELPRFVGPRATGGALPVGLTPVSFDGSRVLRGVEQRQVFRLRPRGLFFTETTGPERDRFAKDLADEIRDRILADTRGGA